MSLISGAAANQAAAFSRRELTAQEQQALPSQPSCPVAPARLRLLTLSYLDFNHQPHHDGQMIVLDAVADDVLKLFQTLYQQAFPIAKIRLMSHYQFDDNAALNDNNTSSYNCRAITGGGKMSLHAYGVAIDINPVQNPYLATHDQPTGQIEISPSAGERYLNRAQLRPGMIEPIVPLIRQLGFTVWGGDWRFPIDYQHVQPSRFVAEMLAGLSSEDAREFFKLSSQYTEPMSAFSTNDTELLLSAYQHSHSRFMTALSQGLSQHWSHSQFISTLGKL